MFSNFKLCLTCAFKLPNAKKRLLGIHAAASLSLQADGVTGSVNHMPRLAAPNHVSSQNPPLNCYTRLAIFSKVKRQHEISLGIDFSTWRICRRLELASSIKIWRHCLLTTLALSQRKITPMPRLRTQEINGCPTTLVNFVIREALVYMAQILAAT